MIRDTAAFIALTVAFSGSITLSTQSVEAKTSRIVSRNKNYFVPPPPPYTPSIELMKMGMANAQAMYTRNQAAIPQVGQPDTHVHVTSDQVVETKAIKVIDDHDSKISDVEKEIGKLLNL